MRNGAMTDLVTDVVVELGETNLWVTMVRAGRFSRPGLVKGAAPGQFPADLRVTESGRWFWGSRHQLHSSDIVVANVLSRVDDPVPMIVGREAVDGAEMVARQLATLFKLVKPVAPSGLTLVHPVDLSARGRTAVERHLSRRLPDGTVITWISRAAAAVAAAPGCELSAGDRVGILHVGGSSVEAAVWRQSDSAAGDVVAVRVDRGAAGHAVDDVLLAALCSGVGFGRPVGPPNPDLPRLRRGCERAKVALSTETAVDVDVDGTPVRMVRSDLEELSARLLRRQLDTLEAALARSEDEQAPLRRIVLLGGAAAAPSLVQAAGARFEVPVLAVPRVSDAMAKGTTEDVRADQPAFVSAPVPHPGSATPAPPAARADDSNVGALAKARRHWDPVVPLTAIPGGASRSAGPRLTPAAATADRSAAVRPVAGPAASSAVDSPASSAVNSSLTSAVNSSVSSAVNPAPAPVNGDRPAPSAGRHGDAETPAASSVLAAFTRSPTRLSRLPIPAPTNLAIAAALLVSLAAVPAIGGVMQGAKDSTMWAAPNGLGSAAPSGVAGGIGDGPAGALTPETGSPSAPWLSKPTGTLGPNQLLSMVRPADDDDASWQRGLSAAKALGPLTSRWATTSGTTPDSGSTPAGGSAPTGAATPPPGSTSVGATPPTSGAQSAPPASASDADATSPPTNQPPPASDPPSSDPPTSDPPAADPTPSGDPAPEPTTAPSAANVADVTDSTAP